MSQFNKLVPPPNFCQVEEGLFRSGQPTSINLSFLSELKLKTIVWLAVEEPDETLLGWLDDNNLTLYHLGLQEGGAPWDAITVESITDALEHIINPSNFPILVSCSMGRHRTGTVIGCLRRLQGWNLSSTLEEYRRFTGNRRNRLENELRIEYFDTALVKLPQREVRPSWLWLD
ncbi:protein-tyrosine phosphatase [Morchella conica CCBAS932]|uniref:Putative tyrosine-protein phosphatase OCA1 n=1 Tax=Morchella conica CCBAS932 TaxID=1392247 RepID=A0A3N4KJ34_9PEZI|nr:protein-tyrosine phosphatase [Morchella conica CCBAS932]